MNSLPSTTRFLRIQSLSQRTARPLAWLWPGRLALGKLALLAGDPGLGKSLVSLDLCARLSTGQPFPDGSPTPERSGSIVLNSEDNVDDTLYPRLRAFGADSERVFIPERGGENEGPLLFPADVDLLDESLARTGARLVVIDP